MGDILATGASALLAFQRSLDTTGHNIANVGTEGYSRQRVLLQTRPGDQSGVGFFGAGVDVVAVQRQSDRYIFDRMLDSLSAQARLDRFATYAQRVDGWLSGADTGVAQPLQGYFDALQQLAADPTSSAARNVVMGSAGTLVQRFQSLQAQLGATATELNQRLAQAATDATRIASSIAELNQAIVRAQGVAGGAPPNDLLDQREQLVTQLSQRIGIRVVPQDDGALNVFTTGGQALVVGFTSRTLGTVADPFRPGRLDLAIDTGAGRVSISAQAGGGEIGGLLDFRREVLDPAIGDLGRIAASVALAVNAQNARGMDAYGAQGGDLFVPPQPAVSPASTNTGGATASASFGALAQLTGHDYRLDWGGSGWNVTDLTTGAAVTPAGSGTPADPLVFGGMQVVVGGAPAAGDRFLLQSGAGIAGTLALATRDAGRIAVASPLAAAADLANAGTGRIGGVSVSDPADPALLAGVTIAFASAATYSVNGGPPQAYVDGGPISVNGWQVSISGAPAAGDLFTVGAATPGSSDNTNARALGALSTAGLLDNGASSFNAAYAGLVARAGGSAQQAQVQLTAQDAVHAQISADRESVSGVNLDEEAANLIRFQQAYQAAAQVIATANSLFETLLSVVRR